MAPNDINVKSYEQIPLGTRCHIPPFPRNSPAYARSIYDSSFAVTGPKLWIILPRSVTCAPSLESFKSKLTSHILSMYPDQPPVQGYTVHPTQTLYWTGAHVVYNRWSSWISDKSLQEVQEVGLIINERIICTPTH